MTPFILTKMNTEMKKNKENKDDDHGTHADHGHDDDDEEEEEEDNDVAKTAVINFIYCLTFPKLAKTPGTYLILGKLSS